MNEAGGAAVRRPWRARFLPRARIGTRIVAAVVLAMTVVLVAAGAFVFWRVSFALDRQLDQDLRAYDRVVRAAAADGAAPPASAPGFAWQVLRTDGTPVASGRGRSERLLAPALVASADSTQRTVDEGRLLPAPERTPYRITYRRVATTDGPRVVVSAISRRDHDEALRELVLQLLLADLATVAAAGVVGWAAARAVLDPVERYRAAAAAAGAEGGVRLPVDDARDDELARLGRTVNDLLARLDDGRRRERQMLADASHELRSPLALLAAEIEWARHRPRSPAELDDVFASLGAETTRLAALADALLRIEEVDGARDAPSDRVAGAADLADLVEDAVAPHRAAAEAAGRAVEVEVAADVHVVGTAAWTTLAIGNLVANAVVHGRGTVRVAGTATDSAGRAMATVTVTDDGGGIPPDLGERAFERFARAEAARSTPGHGLGLALVESVARRHGGGVELVPGGVRLTLPRG